jgi:hypothetical protein
MGSWQGLEEVNEWPKCDWRGGRAGCLWRCWTLRIGCVVLLAEEWIAVAFLSIASQKMVGGEQIHSDSEYQIIRR